MSYKRSYRESIRVRFQKRVSYPASEHGGSFYIDESWDEYFNVNIHVDTDPFDASVHDCGGRVEGLTTSVAAMNTAQCLSIEKNTDRISQSLIDGFFHSVRTDLSTQVAELKQRLDSRLVLLRQQAVSLQEKQKTMEQDYQRTAARYQKIFDDLNKELSNRIHQVDQPIFQLVADVDASNERMLHTTLVQTAATTSQETALAGAQLTSATMKRHALEAMNQAGEFLAKNAVTDSRLRQTSVEGSGSDAYLAPVCYMEAVASPGQNLRRCQYPEMSAFTGLKTDDGTRTTVAQAITPRIEDEQQQVAAYLQREINRNIAGDEEHAQRVRATINKLFSL